MKPFFSTPNSASVPPAYASPVINDRRMTIVVIANPLVFGHMA